MTIQEDKIQQVGQARNLDFVILHGSVAKGQENKESDIDVAIYRDHGIPRAEFMQIYDEMMPVFSGHDLDLKTLEGASPLFKFKAVYDGKLLFGDPHKFNEFKAYVYQLYVEARPLYSLEKHLLQKGLKTL